jgi:hypothetical protein
MLSECVDILEKAERSRAKTICMWPIAEGGIDTSNSASS